MPHEKLYSLDVAIYATVYVKASSPEEAEKKADEWIGTRRCLEAECEWTDDRRFEDIMKEGEEVSLASMMTLDHLANDIVEMVFDPEEPDAG